MQNDTVKPVIFVKHTCPFCFKVRAFLLEAGLAGEVELREATTPDEEEALHRELSTKAAKVSFPTIRLGDEYLGGSDEIIERLARLHRVRQETLPTLRAYLDGPFAQLMALHEENAGLKQAVS